jgi:hypothetical protein
MRPKISGNYLLVVYDDVPSQVVFTARFMVTEPSSLAVAGNLVASSAVSDRYSRQQLDLIIKLNGFQVLDPERELKIVVRQNGRWDNLLTFSKPMFNRATELDYRYNDSISFSGGNQFRNFDIRSLKYQTERIARIDFDTAFQVYLLADQPRSFKQYVNEEDINGRYVVKNDDHAENSAIEADYAWVHFFLPFPTLISDGTFHVTGDLTGWQLDESSRMYFNPEHHGYELSLLLKQGYYNYQYVFRKKGATAADESLIEGSHWETENEYHIFIYYRERGAQYDRLLSVTSLNFLKP